MTYTEPVEFIENDVLAVGVTGKDGSYIMWQKGLTQESGKDEGIYFEFDDQINGGYDIVQECSVTRDGVHIVLRNGKLVHFYFQPEFKKFDELKAGLKKIYGNKSNIIEFVI